MTTLPAPAGAQELNAILHDISNTTEPGCAFAAAYDGGTRMTGAAGLADIERGIPITSKTVFNIASVSKQFTAFSILLLEARGKLSLDDSIRKFVPELGAYAQNVKLRHLLHHTGGLRDYTGLAEFSGVSISQKLSETDAINLLARQRQANFPPGHEYEYSNTGYFLLALVIERASGQSNKTFAQENIFGPLGMQATTIVDQYPTELPVARGYSESGGKYTIDESLWEPTGDGQVHTTVEDLMKWGENLGHGKAGGTALVERMAELGPPVKGDSQYAMGLDINTYRSLAVMQHSGSWAAYSSYFVRFPNQGLTIAVLCNGPNGNADGRAFAIADVLLKDKLAAVTPSGPLTSPTLLNKMAVVPVQSAEPGFYRSAAGEYLQLVRSEGRSSIERLGARSAIENDGEQTYRIEGPEDSILLAFPTTSSVFLSPADEVFDRIEIDKTSDIAARIGLYDSEDSGLNARIAACNGVLCLAIGGQTFELQPRARGEMEAIGRGYLRFDSTQGFVLKAEDLRAIEFRKSGN